MTALNSTDRLLCPMGAVYCAVRTESVCLFRRTSVFRTVSHVYSSNCHKALHIWILHGEGGDVTVPSFAWDDGRVRKIFCEVPALLGRYTALVGSYVPIVWLLKVGPIGCPETSVPNYQSTLRNVPEEQVLHLQRGGCLK